MNAGFKKLILVAVLAFVYGAAWTDNVIAADDWQTVKERALSVYHEDRRAVMENIDQAKDANVPSEEVSLILSRASERSVSALDFRALIDRVTTAARKMRLTEPFTDKIVEGLAKDVSAPLILSVLDRKLETYSEAIDIIGEKVRMKEGGSKALMSVALAMERGVTSQALREIFTSPKVTDTNTIFHSAHALVDLKELGFSESQGKRIIRGGIQAGYLHNGHSTFIEILSKARQFGNSFEDITKVMESNLRMGLSLSEIAVYLHGKKAPGTSGRIDRGRGTRGRGGPEGTTSPGTGFGRGKF